MDSELISEMPLDVSFWGLVLQADTVVKIVMLILLIASIWSWSIIIEKTKKLFILKKQAETFEEAFWSGESLEKLYKEDIVTVCPSDYDQWYYLLNLCIFISVLFVCGSYVLLLLHITKEKTERFTASEICLLYTSPSPRD